MQIRLTVEMHRAGNTPRICDAGTLTDRACGESQRLILADSSPGDSERGIHTVNFIKRDNPQDLTISPWARPQYLIWAAPPSDPDGFRERGCVVAAISTAVLQDVDSFDQETAIRTEAKARVMLLIALALPMSSIFSTRFASADKIACASIRASP